jgi:hypothetical protein
MWGVYAWVKKKKIPKIKTKNLWSVGWLSHQLELKLVTNTVDLNMLIALSVVEKWI